MLFIRFAGEWIYTGGDRNDDEDIKHLKIRPIRRLVGFQSLFTIRSPVCSKDLRLEALSVSKKYSRFGALR
jgi:hypothetical protein